MISSHNQKYLKHGNPVFIHAPRFSVRYDYTEKKKMSLYLYASIVGWELDFEIEKNLFWIENSATFVNYQIYIIHRNNFI